MTQPFRLFVRCVCREHTNVFSTLASLCTRDPSGFSERVLHVHLVSGDGAASFLQPFERTRNLTVHFGHPETYKKISVWKPKRRGAWSYLYAAELACGFQDPAVIIEDDIVAANGWATKLSELAAVSASSWPDFALSAYYGFPKCPFAGSVNLIEPSPGQILFWGNLMTYWPNATLRKFLPFFRKVVLNNDDMSTDLTVQAFLRSLGGTLLYTNPSLVQHVGDKTTLRDDGRRRSPIYKDGFDG